ncbi:MAG: helix-turn-helix transcriptional regulator [Oligoflexia bacterium]|nr:helix-turn-helix transcriptional regulator [Oligoflexia bacterium]
MTKQIKALSFLDSLIDGKVTSGKIIKARRETLGLTQKEIYELTGIKTTFLSAVENDKRNLGVETASRIAAAIGLHPSSILFPGEIDKDIAKIIKKREKLLKNKAA